MSVSAPGGTRAPAPQYEEDDRGYGWVLFAGTMMAIVGIMNVVEGIAAIGNAHFFTANAHYVAGDLNAWGWTVLIVGIVILLAAVGVYAKNQFARWLGVLGAALNAIAQLLFIPAYPFWSLSFFTLDILIIYGLVAYGGRNTATA